MFSTNIWLPGTVLGIEVNRSKLPVFIEHTSLREERKQRINKLISKICSDGDKWHGEQAENKIECWLGGETAILNNSGWDWPKGSEGASHTDIREVQRWSGPCRGNTTWLTLRQEHLCHVFRDHLGSQGDWSGMRRK